MRVLAKALLLIFEKPVRKLLLVAALLAGKGPSLERGVTAHWLELLENSALCVSLQRLSRMQTRQPARETQRQSDG